MPFKREDTKKKIKTGNPIQKEEKRLLAGAYDSVVRQEQCRSGEKLFLLQLLKAGCQ